MRKKICKMLSLIFFAVMVVTMNGCASKTNNNSETIRVACFPNVTHAQALLGKNTHYFAEKLGEDVQIDWKFFNSGNPEIEAFFAGELDLGFIGPIPAINGFEKSEGEIIILSGAVNGGAVLVARQDSEVDGVLDLANKKVAVPSFGNTQDFMLRMMLDENGLKEISEGGNVEIIPVKNPDLQSFFGQGLIDAAFVPEPWGTQLVESGLAKMVLDVKETWRGGDYPTTVIIGRKSFVEQNGETVRKFLEAHLELTEQYSGDQDATGARINEEILNITGGSLAEDILKASLGKIEMSINPQREALHGLAEAMYARKFINTQVDTVKLCNFEIVNSILAEREQENI